MTRVFVDTDVFVALNDKSDRLHEKVTEILEKIAGLRLRPFTSTNVLLETLTIISQRVGKRESLLLLDELRSGKYQIVHPAEELVLQAEDIFRSIKSKNVSYSDCLNFAIAKAYNIDWIFSFDVHFKKQGFKRLNIEGYPRVENNG